MIIGIDASRANRLHKSGTEWYSFHLICELAKLDDKNEYILYTDEPLSADLVNLAGGKKEISPVDKNGWQKIYSPHNNFKAKVLAWPFKFFWTQGRLSLEMLTARPDVLFVPAHTLPLIHPKKSVVTIHDIGFKRQGNLYSKGRLGYKGKIFNLVVRFLTRGKYGATHFDYLEWSTVFALKRAARIITISEFSKKELLDVYSTPEEKITVVYNGYDKNIYHSPLPKNQVEKVLLKYGLVQPYIFYVGRLEKKKNTVRLIEAFALVKQEHPHLHHKLVLVGDPSFGYDEIRLSIHHFGLDSDVILTGWVPEEDMPFIFAGATAFIFPSNYEGFGIPLLQAMACGTPIVASEAASIPEIAGSAAWYFNPKSSEEMAEKIIDVILSEKLRVELSEDGLERVKAYSWTRSAKETLAVLENL